MSRSFQKQLRRSIVICLPFWLRWNFMLVTSRSIVKAHSVKFSIGVINLPQPQFLYLWSESNQDDNEELGQVRLAVRPAVTSEHMFSPYPQVSSGHSTWNNELSCRGFFSLFTWPNIQAEAFILSLMTYISTSQNTIWGKKKKNNGKIGDLFFFSSSDFFQWDSNSHSSLRSFQESMYVCMCLTCILHV